MVALELSKQFQYRVESCKNEVLRNLHISNDFNVCLEEIVSTVAKFHVKCVPLTISQIIRLKALHIQIWREPSSVVVYKPLPRKVKGRDEL